MPEERREKGKKGKTHEEIIAKFFPKLKNSKFKDPRSPTDIKKKNHSKYNFTKVLNTEKKILKAAKEKEERFIQS